MVVSGGLCRAASRQVQASLTSVPGQSQFTENGLITGSLMVTIWAEFQLACFSAGFGSSPASRATSCPSWWTRLASSSTTASQKISVWDDICYIQQLKLAQNSSGEAQISSIIFITLCTSFSNSVMHLGIIALFLHTHHGTRRRELFNHIFLQRLKFYASF